MIDVEELSQAVVLGILQNSNSVPLGAEIWSSPQEFKKLKTIIEYAVAYSNKQKELTQYDRGFDDGCKHTKKIYEAEIEALKKKIISLEFLSKEREMSKPVAWEGAEEWEPLAWELCADEHGEECCHDLIWDMGGVIPEPWGERWQKYEDEAKRMISMVRKCTHSVKELTPCEELREFQEQQNGVFSEHNACCYRHECRIVWNDWEEIRSNPAELMDEEIAEAISEIVDAIGLNDDCMDEYWVNRGIEAFKAILRKAQEK